jgi:hypothetical protein
MQDMEIEDEETDAKKPALIERTESLASRWRRSVGLTPLPEKDAKTSSDPSPYYWPNDGSSKPKSMIQQYYESNDAYVKRLAHYLTLAPLCGEGTAAALCAYANGEKGYEFTAERKVD